MLLAAAVFSTAIGAAATSANATTYVRVSVKFVLDSSDMRPASGDYTTDQDVMDAIDDANTALTNMGADWQLYLTEIVDVPDIDQWFDADCADKGDMETAAEADPVGYEWRYNAINIYVVNDLTGCGGVCSFPHGGDDIILIQSVGGILNGGLGWLHEIGHYFSLYHTFECFSGSCDTNICTGAGGNAGGVDQACLDSCPQTLNIMSYNSGLTPANGIFSDCQLDLVSQEMDVSIGDRYEVVAPGDHLAVDTITAPAAGTNFSVTVRVQDVLDASATVYTPTLISLSLKTGSGALSGTTTGVIGAGQSSVTISGVRYNVAEAGVVLTATATAGQILTEADSSSFTVGGGTAAKLSIPTISAQIPNAPFSVTVNVLDSNDNATTVTTSRTITLSKVTGTGTLGGTLTGTLSASSGTVTISGVTYSKAESGVSIRATVTSGTTLTAATSNTFTLAAGAVAKLAVATIATQQAGETFNVTINTTDAYGNTKVVTQDTGVSLSVGAGTGMLGGTTTGTITNGTSTVTISGVTYDTLESGVILTAATTSGDVLTSANSNAFNVGAGPASDLTLSTISTKAKDIPFSVVVNTVDQFGNPANVSGSTGVSINVNTGSGAIGGTTTGTISAGTNTATISGVTYDTAETGVILAVARTSGDTLGSANSNAFNVEARVPSKLAIDTIASQAGGTPFSIVVNVLDSSDEDALVTQDTTITLTRQAGTGNLLGTLTGTIAAGEGSITFADLTYDKVESGIVVRATASGGDTLTMADSNAFANAAGPARMTTPTADGDRLTGASFTFIWGPGAGATQYRLWVGTTPLTTAANANKYNASTGTTRQATVTGLPTDGSPIYVKLHSYIGTTWQVRSYTYNAAAAGVATALKVSTIASQTAASTFGVTVQSVDALGDPANVTQDTGVSLALLTGTGAVGGTTTGTITNGTSSVTISGVTYDTAESGVVLRASRTSGDMLTAANSNGFTVNGGASDHLVIETIPAQGRDIPFDVVVSVEDAGNNTTTMTADTTVTLTLDTGSGAVGGTVAGVISAGESSVTISGVTYNTAESGVILTATASGGDTVDPADSNAFNVTARTPAKLTMETIASQGTGQTFDVTVHVLDSSDDEALATQDTTITLTRATGTGTVGGTVSGILLTGESSLTISGVTYGTAETGVSLTATASGGDTLTSATSNTFTVGNAPARMTTPTADGDQLTGASFTFMWDAGVGATQYRLWVGTTPLTSAANANKYNASTGMTRQATVTGLPTDGSPVYVRLHSYIGTTWQARNYTYVAAEVGVPARLVVTNISSQTAANAFNVTVTAVDALGDPANVTANTGVSLAVQTGTGALGGTTTGTITSGGSAVTITGVTYDKAESGVVLRASRTSGNALTAGNSNAFTVAGGTPDHLAITTIPAQGRDIPFDVTVTVKDAGNNATTMVTSTTITLTVDTGSGAVGGTVAGVIGSGESSVTIEGVTYDTSETGVILTATGSGGDTVTAADSNAFDVTTRTPAKLAIDTIASQGTNLTFDVTIHVLDASDDEAVVTQDTTVTLTRATGTGAVGGTVSGVLTTGTSELTISGVTYNTAESGVSLTATASGGDSLTAATSNTFTVGNMPARMTTPAMDGDALTGASFTFMWDTGAGATQYRLWVGTTPLTTAANANKYNQSTGTTRQATVTGLPTDGSPVYVKLHSYINGAWQARNYTYEAVTAGVATKLQIVSISTQAAGASFSVTVNAVDGLGDPANVSSDTAISLARQTGTGAIGGTITGTITSGTNGVTISGVTYDTAEAGVVLRASRTSGDTLTAANSNAFTVTGGAPAALAVATVVDQGAGDAFNLVVTVEDALGNPTTVTQNTAISVSVDTGSGAVGGTTTGTITTGAAGATITGITYDTVETGVILTIARTSGDSLTSVDTNAFDVTAGAPDHLTISNISGQTAASAFSVTVTMKDSLGNDTDALSDTTVTLTLDTGTGNLGGTLTGTITDGTDNVVISGVTYDKAEAGVVLTATASGGDTVDPDDSNSFNVAAGAASKLAIDTIADQGAGETFSVTVRTTDSVGNAANVTQDSGVSLSRATGTGTLGGTTTGTVTNGSNSVTISGVTYDTLETGVSLTASRTSGDVLTAITSNTFDVGAGAPSDFEIGTIASQTAGDDFSVVVNSVDQYGNPADVSASTGFSITVDTGNGTLGGTTTGTIAMGTNTVTVTGVNYDTAEAGVVLDVSRTSGDMLGSATSNAFTVGANTADNMVITTIAGQTAGSNFNVTATAKDALDNSSNVTSDTTITLTLKTGTGSLGGTLSGVITSGSNSVTISGVNYDVAEAGVVITATASGGQTLAAEDSNAFTVSAGALSNLRIATISDQGAGDAFSVTVKSTDSVGNSVNVTQDTAFSLTRATGTGTLGGTTTGTITNGSNSVTVMGVTYDTLETGVSLTATRTSGDVLAAGTSNTFDVGGGAAADLAVATIAQQRAGVAFDVVVSVVDQYGNPTTVSGDTAVGLAVATGAGNIGGTTTGTILSGTASITISGVTYDRKESGVSFTASRSSGDTVGSADSNSFTVIEGPASKFAFGTIGTKQAGVSFGVQVRSVDQYGNTSNVAANTAFSFSVGAGTGALSGTTTGTITAGTSTVTVSGVIYDTMESGVKIQATRTSGDSLTSAQSNAFTVNAGPASQLTISTLSAQTAGTGFGVTVNSKDQYGNAANVSATTTITLDVATGTGSMVGTVSGSLTAGSNTVTISGVKYDVAESGVSLSATASGGFPLDPATSNTFAVSAGAVSALAVDAVEDAEAGTGFDVVVHSTDQYGNPKNVSSDTSFSLTVGSGTGNLGGTTTGTITNGSNSVTVSGVTYDVAESGVTLTATRTGGDSLSAGTSDAFDVSAGAAAKLAIDTISSHNKLAPFDVVVRVLDANDNETVATTATAVILSVHTGSGALGGTLTGTIGAGQASVTIEDITYDTVETGVVLTATRTGGDSVTAGDSNSFDITLNAPVALAIDTISTKAKDIGFTVTVRMVDSGGEPTLATTSTLITIARQTGTGTLSGTKTGTITAGTSSVTIGSMAYNTVETGVVLRATASGGDTVTLDDSDPFEVKTTVPAAMTTPSSNGGTLTGASFTFAWDAGINATQYRLWVGTGPLSNAASANLYNQSTGSTQSATVTGLPTNGSAVYVRLHSYISSTWVYNDYQYVAASGSLIAPPGSGGLDGLGGLEEGSVTEEGTDIAAPEKSPSEASGEKPDSESFDPEVVNVYINAGSCGAGASLMEMAALISLCGAGIGFGRRSSRTRRSARRRLRR